MVILLSKIKHYIFQKPDGLYKIHVKHIFFSELGSKIYAFNNITSDYTLYSPIVTKMMINNINVLPHCRNSTF